MTLNGVDGQFEDVWVGNGPQPSAVGPSGLPNPYELDSKNVDMVVGNVAIGLSMFVGGEILGAAMLFSIAPRVAALKAGVSGAAQISANGLRNLDVADVGIDALPITPYASAFLGAEIDFQPFRQTGPILGIGGLIGDKSINQVGFETGANLLFGNGSEKYGLNIYGNYFLNSAGKSLTNAGTNYLFGK